LYLILVGLQLSSYC